MENLYKRVDNLDEQLRSVKLPYFAWKVLFCVTNDSEINEITKLLEADETEVQASLDILTDNGLIVLQQAEVEVAKEEPEQQSAPEADEAVESIIDEESEDTEETIEESVLDEAEEEQDLEEEVEPEPEVQESEPAEETIETNEVEETVEMELDEIDTDEEEIAESDEVEIETNEEELDLLAESEKEENTIESDILDELVEDSEELDTELEEDTETEQDQVETDTEEKIEINIPEGEEEETTEDLEFNFNLTGDEEPQSKPLKEEKAPEKPAQPEVDTSGFKKILVIDDSLVIRKMVEIALEEEEFKIETAVSGKEGLEIMDQTNPDLVILDMMLPDINGIEILKTIKASKGIPVIMLSGKDSPQMIETAKNEGAEEFLPKPFKDDDLVDKIKKLLNA